MAKLLNLFVGVEPLNPWLESLCRAQEQLGDSLDGLLRIDAECFHVSLMSVGLAGLGRLDRIAEALERAGEDCEPFDLEVDRIMAFGPAHAPRSLCAGVRGEVEKLVHLRHRIRRALDPLGTTAPIGRSFTPHVTLLRIPPVRRDDVGSHIARVMARTIVPPAEPLTVHAPSCRRRSP
jgi:2'-5' RNA ligase